MTCEMVNVKDVSDQALETESGLFYLTDVVQRLDIRNGNLIYLVNVDLPAKIEAENLRQLRRSTALKNMFNFEVKNKMDMMVMMPWVIVIALILFK
ncbi:hypothetical protein D3C76_1447330 [compost metagenome]